MTSDLCMRSRRRRTCKYQILCASRHRAPYCSSNPVESFTTVCMSFIFPYFLFDLDLCNTLLSQKVLLIMNDVSLDRRICPCLGSISLFLGVSGRNTTFSAVRKQRGGGDQRMGPYPLQRTPKTRRKIKGNCYGHPQCLSCTINI
jgi:hypothetical protein